MVLYFGPGSKAAHCSADIGFVCDLQVKGYVVIKERNQILNIWPCVWTACEPTKEDVGTGVLLCIFDTAAIFFFVRYLIVQWSGQERLGLACYYIY